MGRYFKVVEITQAEFVNKVWDDVTVCDEETEILVEMDTMNQVGCDL